eukprot:GFUD01010355.1.p1 GENE.GFUD01010355.1~~GFUD01010355.1.p1  ORF type:complete len:560 (-),score=190.97 GFUD01010355.1:230-1909(-)
MVSVCVDRGVQLDQYRQDHLLTDVVLKSSSLTLPCHKLVLSLHSPYFRTLFQSKGFVESDQSMIELTHIKPDLLEVLVSFIYTGRLEVEKESAVELLEVASILQLADQQLVDEVKRVLTEAARQADTFQELFYIWNTAVTYELDQVVEVVLTVLEVKLEQFLSSPSDVSWLCMLGWEEMKQVLDREGLCVQSEATLLELAIVWANDKVEDQEEYTTWLQLLQSVRLTLLDKKFVKQQLAKNFPLYSDIKPRVPAVKYPRTCYNCVYLVQFKLAKMQIRNIEDFIDKGEKSLFLGFNLAGRKVKRLSNLSSMSSMVGTAAGNYSRPVTSGSLMFQYRHLVVVVGGQTDSDMGKVRTDILIFSSESECWMTSLKHYIRSRPRAKLQDIIMVGSDLFLIWVPTKLATSTPVIQNVMRVLLETNDRCAVVERLDLKAACEQSKLEREVVGEVPEDLWDRPFGCVRVESNIYCVSEGSTWKLNTSDCSWTKLPPPIGTVGRTRPVMAYTSPLLYLVGGRQEDSTNSVQVMDTVSNTWRRLPNLNTRMTPLDMFCHCGELFLVGW